MINVTVQKLSTNSIDFGERLLIDSGNNVAEQYAEIVRMEFQDLKCKEHPDANQHILITAVKGTVPTVEKNFCCNDFKDSIRFEFKN
ncbi:MAG: hypothetical protein IPM95_11415 [Sphingobacteriales bacterium]|nr:hypothetical protein [Sphingobacteriales bacterium]